MNSVLDSREWVQFNESTWNLTGKMLESGDAAGAGTYAGIQVYVGAKGKLRTPPRVPYHAVQFRPTPSPSRQKRERQWLDASADLASQMHEVGFGGAISFGPEVTDVRAWQALGYRAEVRYTYVLDIPYSLTTATNAVRKNIKKADRAGYACERSEDFAAIIACLQATESRQGFNYGLDERDLKRLHALLGTDRCRMYLCRTADGEAVSSRIVLHTAGGKAIDWVAGTRAEHLQQGVTQQIINFALQDLESSGAVEFDYGGANIASVARSKMEWGGVLTPFYTIRPVTLKSIAIDGQAWARSAVRTLARRDR